MEKSLQNRLTFGPLMLAGLFLLLWGDSFIHFRTGIQGVGILLMLILLLPLATEELATLFTAEHVRPYRFISSIGSGAMVLHAFMTQFDNFKPVAASTLAFIVVFVMLLAALRRAWDMQAQDAIVRMAGTVLANMYLGGLGWFLLALRVKQSHNFVGSTGIVLLILVVVKATDIGAFFGGRALGRHKLIPWLSPGKTWEGLICGVLVSGIIGALAAPHLYGMAISWQRGFVICTLLGGIGQVGDLLESLIKRDAEVKDSGRLIPGFGGVLDVIDSPLLASPFAYLLFSLFTHARV